MRHGKQNHDHHQAAKHHHQQQSSEPPAKMSSSSESFSSSNYKKDAEAIVQHDNALKSKLPTYKGLESFKLLDIMGESVIFFLFLYIPN